MEKKALLLIVTVQLSCYAAQAKKVCPRFSDRITHALGIDCIPVHPDAHLFFRKSARLGDIVSRMPQDEFNHLYRLEKFFKVSDMVAQATGFIRGNSSSSIVHYRLAHALMSSKDRSEAAALWRKVEEDINPDPCWTEFNAITETPSAVIGELQEQVQAHDAVAHHTIIPDLVKRIYGTSAGSHKACDDRQIAQKPHPVRTLDKSIADGLMLEIPAHKVEQIKEAFDPFIPLIERLKNKRFVTIGGLRNSKVSLLVHDHFDHAMTFKLLWEANIFSRYETFLAQVGNPQKCDILSRESELIASIAYDYRFTSFPRFRQLSLMTYDDQIK